MLEREQHAAASYFPEELSTESKAVTAVRRVLDDDLDFRERLEIQLADAEEWARSERKYRKRLHAKLQEVYLVYALAAGNSKREALIHRRCDSAGIAETRASHLTIQLVKLLLRPANKSVYQYAAALRYAALTKIPVGNLAASLAKEGGSPSSRSASGTRPRSCPATLLMIPRTAATHPKQPPVAAKIGVDSVANMISRPKPSRSSSGIREH